MRLHDVSAATADEGKGGRPSASVSDASISSDGDAASSPPVSIKRHRSSAAASKATNSGVSGQPLPEAASDDSKAKRNPPRRNRAARAATAKSLDPVIAELDALLARELGDDDSYRVDDSHGTGDAPVNSGERVGRPCGGGAFVGRVCVRGGGTRAYRCRLRSNS